MAPFEGSVDRSQFVDSCLDHGARARRTRRDLSSDVGSAEHVIGCLLCLCGSMNEKLEVRDLGTYKLSKAAVPSRLDFAATRKTWPDKIRRPWTPELRLRSQDSVPLSSDSADIKAFAEN